MAIDINNVDATNVRRKSHGTLELQDDNGRRRTVQLDDMNAADRELAEKFGYKPVRSPPL